MTGPPLESNDGSFASRALFCSSVASLIIGVLLTSTTAGCAAREPGPVTVWPASEPAALERESPHDDSPLADTPPGLHGLLAPCLPEDGESLLALETALDSARDRRDTRCWVAIEIALAHRLLERLDGLDDERRSRQIRLSSYRFRQAELRANRYAFYDLAAVAHHGRARVEMRRADREAALRHLARSTEIAGLYTAASGDASPTFDSIFVERMIELLAAWERSGDAKLIAATLETASQLKAREALRAFESSGVDSFKLAEVSGRDAFEAVEALRAASAESRSTFGRENRRAEEKRLVTSEAVAENCASWVASAPLLLAWLPARAPELMTTLTSVFGPGEVLLDYTVGDAYGVVLAISLDGFAAHPLPGRRAVEEAVNQCRLGACDALDEMLLEPAARLLEGARQVLVAAHGPLHLAPFESRLAQRVVRVPSALGLTALRLREWEGSPRPRPAAADLLPGAVPHSPASSHDEPRSDEREGMTVADEPDEETPAEPDDSGKSSAADQPRESPRFPSVRAPKDSSGMAVLWATLAAGAHLVEWVDDDEEPRLYGAPLTVPSARPGIEAAEEEAEERHEAD